MTTDACNIGTAGQLRRKRIGMILLVGAGILSGYFIANHTPWVYRLWVFPFFAGGFVSMLEGERKVCVLYAHQKKVDAR